MGTGGKAKAAEKLPCPECGHMQYLIWGDGTGAGIRWAPKNLPTRAWYQCENGCEIEGPRFRGGSISRAGGKVSGPKS